MSKKCRRKAWLGAAIGLASTGINLIAQARNAAEQEKQMLQQRSIDEFEQAKNKAINNAITLTSGYNNTEYADKVRDKIVFKAGGKISSDRIQKLRQFKCGGRSKRK